jgi:DNA-directed RNA polymerase specialized sigma subunit, sigma24 homolog
MNKTIQAVYQQAFPAVARYVSRCGGTFEEAKDVFHEALLVFFEKKYEDRLFLQRSEEAYIFGIARHLWAKRHSENQRYASLDQLMEGFESENVEWERGDDASSNEALSNKRILRLLQAAGRKCMRVLTAFYYEKLDMQELAHRFGFSGTRSATVQKFKCLQKVKQVVKEKSLEYEDFVG